MQLESAKGTKNFSNEEAIKRSYIIETLRKIFEKYGFNPLETPILQKYDVLTAKYAGGSEITKEIFKLKDQGNRDLCLRYDLTVPLAIFVGLNPTLKLPLKRYEISKVFRDGPIKAGRLREFWQCDVDTVGSNSMISDAEFIEISQEGFKALKIKIDILINNRKILDGILESFKIEESKRDGIILTIDKLDYLTNEEITKELESKEIKNTEELLKIFSLKGNNETKIKALKKIIKSENGIKGLEELEEILSYSKSKNVIFEISLARGLSYYTGTIFEVKLQDKSKLKVSLAGGGRYDNMIGFYTENKQNYPAVGISFGIEPILAALDLKENKKTLLKVYVIPIKTTKQAYALTNKLRKKGINCDLDMQEKSISKNLDYANKIEVPYVLFLGSDELKSGKYKLKNMKSGKEKYLTEKKLIKELTSVSYDS